jgi:large subunit ribosomal protein L4
VHILWPDQLNTYDVLLNDVVLFTSAALETVPGRPDRRETRPLARQSPAHEREGGAK